jgi:hypothetical protein
MRFAAVSSTLALILLVLASPASAQPACGDVIQA